MSGTIVLGPSLKYIFSGMLPEEKIHTVFNCLDNQYLISNEEFEEKIQAMRDKSLRQVLYLSNFIRSKGYFNVLKMAQLEKENVKKGREKKLHFHFAGRFFQETERHFFESYIRTNHLEDFVTYHGVVDGNQKYELLKACDIFVLPTRYQNEGQPISILEAMGNAMTIVSTDHAGIPDIVQNNVNGVIIKKNDTTKMVYEKLISFNSDQLIEFGRRNRCYCNDQFTQNKYIETIKKIFRKLV